MKSLIKQSVNPRAENRRMWISLFLALAAVILPALFPSSKRNAAVYTRVARDQNAAVYWSEGAPQIDINRADAALLMELPGIGERRAREIIKYREDNGPYPSTEALLNVPTITQKVYDDILSGICVAPPD